MREKSILEQNGINTVNSRLQLVTIISGTVVAKPLFGRTVAQPRPLYLEEALDFSAVYPSHSPRPVLDFVIHMRSAARPIAATTIPQADEAHLADAISQASVE
jgi:hypothetical protein